MAVMRNGVISISGKRALAEKSRGPTSRGLTFLHSFLSPLSSLRGYSIIHESRRVIDDERTRSSLIRRYFWSLPGLLNGLDTGIISCFLMQISARIAISKTCDAYIRILESNRESYMNIFSFMISITVCLQSSRWNCHRPRYFVQIVDRQSAGSNDQGGV